MMTLCFTKANGRRKVVNIQGDSVTIKNGFVMDGDIAVAVSALGGFIMTSDVNSGKHKMKLKMFTTMEITQGEEG